MPREAKVLDYEALLQEVVRRVMQKLAALEAAKNCTPQGTCSCKSEITFEEPCCKTKEKTIAKRVVTEKDLIAARGEGVTCVCLGERTIVTDVAREYATKFSITLKKPS